MRKILLAVLALAPSLAVASGYSLPNVNPRDVAVSASAVAAQLDAGAVVAMPAALARIKGPSVRLGASALNIKNTWKDPAGTGIPPASLTNGGMAEADTSKWAPLPVGYVSYGGKLDLLGERGWGVGASFDEFGGGAVEWPKDWTGRYRIVKVDRKVLRTMLAGGIELLPQVRLGGGLIYYYTTQTLTQNAPLAWITTPPNPAQPDAVGELHLTGGQLSYSLSLEADPIPGVPLRVAVDYKHKATQELSGTVKWTDMPAPFAAGVPIFRNQDVDETLTIPNTVNVGVSYRVIKPLLVMATYTLDRWLVYDADHFVGTEAGADLNVARDYKNGYTFRAGAEYDVNRAVAVRIGAQRDVSGLRTSTYSPTLPDGTSWAGSAGATYRFGDGFGVDVGVFYAVMDKVTTSNNSPTEPAAAAPPTTIRGEFTPSALITGLAVTWTPGYRPDVP